MLKFESYTKEEARAKFAMSRETVLAKLAGQLSSDAKAFFADEDNADADAITVPNVAWLESQTGYEWFQDSQIAQRERIAKKEKNEKGELAKVQVIDLSALHRKFNSDKEAYGLHAQLRDGSMVLWKLEVWNADETDKEAAAS